MKSKILSLKYRDLFKGFVVSMITVLITSLYNIIKEGNFPNLSDWKMIGATALTAGLSYLIKNFCTNSEGEILKREPENKYR